MAPDLVICPSADSFKVYPGGVIVLQCAEWLGAARGTLTTEADARSCCGTVVRDSQTVATSIYDSEIAANTTALAAADDTFVIDLSLLPIESGFDYDLYISLLIEGDWNPADDDTTRDGHQEKFPLACQGRYWMDALGFLSDTQPLDFKPRLIDSYRIVGASTAFGVVGTEVMTWRFYSQSGTTCEFLLDQIYFVPSAFNNTGTWESDDFQIFGGGQGTATGFVDGADGGDGFGKFTWRPTPIDDPLFATSPGGGDYQRDPLDEYMIHVVPPDYFIWNSQSSSEAVCHAYGLHGPFYVPTQVWTLDDFSRTAGDNNYAGADGHFTTQSPGDTPEGFGWLVDNVTGPVTTVGSRRGRTVWVDGSELCFENRGGGSAVGADIRVNLFGFGGETVQNIGARIKDDNEILSGTFHADSTAGSAAGLTLEAWINTNFGVVGINPNAIQIMFDLQGGTWQMYVGNGPVNPLGSLQTLTGYTLGDVVAFKIEVRRYIARAKVWDAGSGEPGAWDVEEFRDLWGGAIYKPYPYDDDLSYSIEEDDIHSVFIRYVSNSTPTNQVIFKMDDIQVEHDAGGTNESSWASVEQPEGNEIGSMEFPAGCQHFVYWGTRDWTALDGGFPYLDFSAKSWNDSGAAELQRAETVMWWFRSVHAALIPMNWRSADRSPRGQNRILTGG